MEHLTVAQQHVRSKRDRRPIGVGTARAHVPADVMSAALIPVPVDP